MNIETENYNDLLKYENDIIICKWIPCEYNDDVTTYDFRSMIEIIQEFIVNRKFPTSFSWNIGKLVADSIFFELIQKTILLLPDDILSDKAITMEKLYENIKKVIPYPNWYIDLADKNMKYGLNNRKEFKEEEIKELLKEDFEVALSTLMNRSRLNANSIVDKDNVIKINIVNCILTVIISQNIMGPMGCTSTQFLHPQIIYNLYDHKFSNLYERLIFNIKKKDIITSSERTVFFYSEKNVDIEEIKVEFKKENKNILPFCAVYNKGFYLYKNKLFIYPTAKKGVDNKYQISQLMKSDKKNKNIFKQMINDGVFVCQINKKLNYRDHEFKS